MSLLQEMFPLLIPIFVIDVILAVAAVRHILRHPHYRLFLCLARLSILFLGEVRKNECAFYTQSI